MGAAVNTAAHDPGIRSRHRRVIASYCAQGFAIGRPTDIDSLPPAVVGAALDKIRRHWRYWLAAETGIAVIAGPWLTIPLFLELVGILAGWVVEAGYACGVNAEDPVVRRRIAQCLGQELWTAWLGDPKLQRRGYRWLMVGWGQEWVWADQMIVRVLARLQSADTAAKMSSAISSMASMPTAIRTVSSEIPIARRASSVCDRWDAING